MSKLRGMIPKSKQTSPKHTYLFRAEWHATAKLFRVVAKNEEEAIVKAEKAVLRMEGGNRCLNVRLLRMVK